MARYYYDRHNYTSTTTYTWSKYYTKETDVYAEEDWGSQYSSQYDQIMGYKSYSFDPATGRFAGVGSYDTMYPGSYPKVLYRVPAGADVLEKYMYSSTAGSKIVYWHNKGSYISHTNYERGSLHSYVYGSYSQYVNNARNSDGFWYVRGSASTTYNKGAYVDTIIAEQGTYPANGISGSYWYVLGKRAFPDFKTRQGGQLKSSVDGWVRVDGQLRQIQQIWVRANGQLKEI